MARDRPRDFASLLDFIPADLHPAIAEGRPDHDLSLFLQAALDHQLATGDPLFAPSGTYRIDRALIFAQHRTDEQRAFGLVLIGAGVGRTIFRNQVPDGQAMLTITMAPAAIGATFARGTYLSNFAIVGDDRIGHNGIALQACWFNTLINVRIAHCGGNGGTNPDGGVGLLLGADASSDNPDRSAVVATTLLGCEIRHNGAGISNPANNNAPSLTLLNTHVIGNARYGLWTNSSALHVGPGCSIAYNGARDPANAAGGIRIQQRRASRFSNNYVAKQITIAGCEIESNYPQNLALFSVEGASISNLALGWRDWAGTALRAWPSESVLIGGANRAEGRASGVHFDQIRWWAHSERNVRGGPGTARGGIFHFIRIQPWGSGVTMRNSAYLIDNEPAASAQARLRPGINIRILKEDPKPGDAGFHAGHYCDYDLPLTGAGRDWAFTMFDTPFRKTFPGSNANLHFSFLLDSDQVRVIPAPTLGGIEGERHWGQFAISISGTRRLTGLFGFRAIAPAELYRISPTGEDYALSTRGPLTGRSGAAGAITLAVDTQGNIFVENRSGSATNITFSHLMNPGMVALA